MATRIRICHDALTQGDPYSVLSESFFPETAMINLIKASIGQWYADRTNRRVFQVVAIDDDAGLIEVQDLDGDVDEFDTDTWRTLSVDRVDEPEDWVSPPGERDADDPSYGSEGDRLRDAASSRLDGWSSPADAAFDLDDALDTNAKGPP